MSGRTKLAAAGILCAGLAAGPIEVFAQTKIEAGTLTCSGEGAFGAILGSQQSLDCTFKPIDQPPQSYTASITKIGLDIGVTGKTVLVWSVLAPTAQLKPKALSGTYVGGAASVSVGIGGGANLLVGGFDQTITLQPLSVQGQTGVNLAVGVAGLSLE